MKTKRFCELIELAISEEYGEESKFDTVPYLLPDGDRDTKLCLGAFLSEDVHMGVVAARAMHILWTDFMRDKETAADDQIEDIDQAMTEFVEIMNVMKIAPYMQWHCAYFPGLTDAQVLAESEAFDEPRIDMIGLRMDGAPDDAMMSAEQLYAELDNVAPDGAVRWYSGRGMMGKDCVAVSGSTSDCLDAIGTVRERANEATLVAMNDVRTDNMGHDVVYYFPNFLKPTGDGSTDPVDGSFVPN